MCSTSRLRTAKETTARRTSSLQDAALRKIMIVYKEIDGITVYAETTINLASREDTTRFFHIEDTGRKQYFRCEYNSITNDKINSNRIIDISEELEQIIDTELALEIEKYLKKDVDTNN